MAFLFRRMPVGVGENLPQKKTATTPFEMLAACLSLKNRSNIRYWKISCNSTAKKYLPTPLS